MSHATPHNRIRSLNAQPVNTQGEYVLYWMQMYRRLSYNHALDHALGLAENLGKPLVVYEGLRLDYPWASVRHHRFILEGMRDNARQARQMGLNYWPFVATAAESGRGLLRGLASRAAVVVTDDYPAFIVPAQSAALANKITCAMVAVDGNSVVPLSVLGAPVAAAAHLRPRIHKAFAAAWGTRAIAEPVASPVVRATVEPPFAIWDAEQDLSAFLTSLPIDQSVRAVPGVVGGSVAGRKVLGDFVSRRLARYAEHRSPPDHPDDAPSSQLSPYIHYGHVSLQEIAETVLNVAGPWTPSQLRPAYQGKRDGFFHTDANVNGFLDEAFTWRDVGFHWHRHRAADTASLKQALPAWAYKTLSDHAQDVRTYVYTLAEWESAQTHDALWNAAQRELVLTGRMQNYLRMLWGKKVLEWSASPEEAYQTLVHLNNKYAYDGRDPNSYTGILWTFGLFDRPWPPERKVTGTIRYMSSENTAKKFNLKKYLAYVHSLGVSKVAKGV